MITEYFRSFRTCSLFVTENFSSPKNFHCEKKIQRRWKCYGTCSNKFGVGTFGGRGGWASGGSAYRIVTDPKYLKVSL